MTAFVYDSERLSTIAPETVCREGLAYFKDKRVIDCYEQDGILYATVEGASDPSNPYRLELEHDDQGIPQVLCECGTEPEQICKHAIAALLSHAQDTSLQVSHVSAMEAAIQDRRKRGQTEVRVSHLTGHPWFGKWQAHSLGVGGSVARRYEVHIRSLQDRINFCTCPDRANNQLGTCKHIEAALHQIGKNPKLAGKDLSPPVPFVYLAWEGEETVRLQRTPSVPADLAEVLDQFFDPRGRIKGQLPEAFFQFENAVYADDRIEVGIDARQGVERLATKQAQQLRAQQIRQRISAMDGRLPGLKAQLYPYQVEGVAFLAANGRALLADDMGLGKTLQAIAAANWLIHESGVTRVLILCPASLKHQWAREIEKFTGQLTQVVQGNAEARLAQYRQEATFFVLNYEIALRDLSVINERLAPDLLILDEAQRIKNWRTLIATTVKQIQSRYAFVLTGTPLENRLEDLYSLMQVVDQHLLGPLWRYLNDYHITDDKGKVIGYRNLSELRQKISPVMLRRNRRIVSDQLPSRTLTRIDVNLTQRQQELHDAALYSAQQLAQITKKRPLTPSEQNRLMAALQTARMACDAAGLVDKETEGSPKLTELKTLIEEQCLQNGQKMVVFSQWMGMTLMVEALLRKMKVGFVHLNGQVPTAKRGELMERFQNDPEVAVFVSTDAGGTGLNLQAASLLVNLDIPWNPAVLEQRNARIHRLGQKNKVQIVLMVAIDAYEERVLRLIGSKQNLFDNVVDPAASEDVIGISTKSIAAVIDELNQKTASASTDDGIGSPDNATASIAKGDVLEEGKGSEGGVMSTAPEAGSGIAQAGDLAESDASAEGDMLARGGATVDGDALAADATLAEGAVQGATAVASAADEPAEQQSRRFDLSSLASTDEAEVDILVRQGIRQLQNLFGARLEKMLVRSGSLMLILDRVDDADEAVLEQLGLPIPVAVIDSRTCRQLQRLGAASPLADSRVLEPVSPPPVAVRPWLRAAREKIQACRILLEHAADKATTYGKDSPVMELSCAALSAYLADAANLARPLSIDELPVWVYTTAVPQRLIDERQTAMTTRLLSLRLAASIPADLFHQTIGDLASLVEGA